MKTSISRGGLRGPAAAIALCLAATMACAQMKAPPDRAQLERKLQSTATLIERSSGAKQIEASGVPEAAAQRAKARELHQKAAAALAAGDLEGTTKLLDESSRAMFAGVRLAAPTQVTEGKLRADYQARLDSTRALIEAQKRISAEKGGGGAADAARKAEALVADADKLAAAGKMDEARRTLDQAYITVKAAIGRERQGTTLVRSLDFATPADEYAYEISRNDSHRSLVEATLKAKRGDPAVEERIAASAKLRTQAEGEAARKDHKAAIRTLEESTKELVNAIRAAGVYIPG